MKNATRAKRGKRTVSVRIMPPLLPSREIARDTVFRTKAYPSTSERSQWAWLK
jgi:hypothetical protein